MRASRTIVAAARFDVAVASVARSHSALTRLAAASARLRRDTTRDAGIGDGCDGAFEFQPGVELGTVALLVLDAPERVGRAALAGALDARQGSQPVRMSTSSASASTAGARKHQTKTPSMRRFRDARSLSACARMNAKKRG